MDPVISLFPNRRFYNNKINNDNSVISRYSYDDSDISLFNKIRQLLGTMTFFDIKDSKESNIETSYENIPEA